MKENFIKEYRNKNQIDLEKDLAGFRRDLAKSKFDLAGGKVKNIRAVRRVKKNIARLLTFISLKKNEKQN